MIDLYIPNKNRR